MLSRAALDDYGRTADAPRRAGLARAAQEAGHSPSRARFLAREAPSEPWPGLEFGDAAMSELLAAQIHDGDRRDHLAARALEGRSADPFLFGSALHLIAPGCGDSGGVAGGMDRLADALAAVAQASGAEVRCGVDVADIRREKERVCGVTLADGTDFVTGAVISTLDVKRTFLSFFQWNTLKPEVARAVSAFRFAGSTARLLIALDAPPDLSRASLPEVARGPIHIAPNLQDFAFAHAAWRANTIPERLPMTARLVSAADPRLAPIGAATMTLTIGSVPHRLFDGAWTREKRDQLRDRALTALETALPGTQARIQHVETIVPPDIEEQIGATGRRFVGRRDRFGPDVRFPARLCHHRSAHAHRGAVSRRPILRHRRSGELCVGRDRGSGRPCRSQSGIGAMSQSAIVIGGGVNGLVAASYLARAGRRVTLLEAEDRLGGLCRAPSPVHALYALDPVVLRDLKLARHGLRFAVRDMPLIGLRGDGRHVAVGRDVYATARHALSALARRCRGMAVVPPRIVSCRARHAPSVVGRRCKRRFAQAAGAHASRRGRCVARLALRIRSIARAARFRCDGWRIVAARFRLVAAALVACAPGDVRACRAPSR